MNYKLQNRYQDSGWENLNEECSHLETAKHRAYELSKNSIAYGMVRVVNRATGAIEAEYPAGGGEATSKPPEELELWYEYRFKLLLLSGLQKWEKGDTCECSLPKPCGEATSKPPKELKLWQEYTVYIDGLTGRATVPICGLCGDTGYVSTLNIRTSNGELVPTIRQACICPNGRAIKKEAQR